MPPGLWLLLLGLLGTVRGLITGDEGPPGFSPLRTPVYFPIFPEDFKDFGLRLGGDVAAIKGKSLRMPNTTPKPTTTTDKLPINSDGLLSHHALESVTQVPGPSYLTDSYYYLEENTPKPEGLELPDRESEKQELQNLSPLPSRNEPLSPLALIGLPAGPVFPEETPEPIEAPRAPAKPTRRPYRPSQPSPSPSPLRQEVKVRPAFKPNPTPSPISRDRATPSAPTTAPKTTRPRDRATPSAPTTAPKTTRPRDRATPYAPTTKPKTTRPRDRATPSPPTTAPKTTRPRERVTPTALTTRPKATRPRTSQAPSRSPTRASSNSYSSSSSSRRKSKPVTSGDATKRVVSRRPLFESSRLGTLTTTTSTTTTTTTPRPTRAPSPSYRTPSPTTPTPTTTISSRRRGYRGRARTSPSPQPKRPTERQRGRKQEAPVYHTSTKSYRAPSSLFYVKGATTTVTAPAQPDFIQSDPNIYVPVEYDEDAIPGVAFIDYPAFSTVPDTEFMCDAQEHPGLYADTDAQCQIFHICQEDGRHDSFLCPNGTVFNQQYFVCDWWYNFSCDHASRFYSLNALIYEIPDEDIYSRN